jgi:hypothetical protein
MKKVHLACGAAAVAAVAPAVMLAPTAQAATRMVSCSAAPRHWTDFKGGEGSYYCFGYNGGTWTDGTTLPVGGECGGNNYGWWVDDIYGKTNFGPGTTYRNAPGVYSVHINSWAGSDTCPT